MRVSISPIRISRAVCASTWPSARARRGSTRSEEHTSELQSQFHLVCRLLLEKKNRLRAARLARVRGLIAAVLSPRPGRTLFPCTTLFRSLHAEEAWELTRGSPDVVIAIVDAGLDLAHPDLAGRLCVNLAEREGAPGLDEIGRAHV